MVKLLVSGMAALTQHLKIPLPSTEGDGARYSKEAGIQWERKNPMHRPRLGTCIFRGRYHEQSLKLHKTADENRGER